MHNQGRGGTLGRVPDVAAATDVRLREKFRQVFVLVVVGIQDIAKSAGDRMLADQLNRDMNQVRLLIHKEFR